MDATLSSVLLVVPIDELLSSSVTRVGGNVLTSVDTKVLLSSIELGCTSVVCSVMAVGVDNSFGVNSVLKGFSVTVGVIVSSILLVVSTVALLPLLVSTVDINVLSSVKRGELLSTRVLDSIPVVCSVGIVIVGTLSVQG